MRCGLESLSERMTRFVFGLYRYLISPAIHLICGAGMGCRFSPTCGEYGRQAVLVHGWYRGGLLAARRICRCHPWGSSGMDPVPPRRESNAKEVSGEWIREA